MQTKRKPLGSLFERLASLACTPFSIVQVGHMHTFHATKSQDSHARGHQSHVPQFVETILDRHFVEAFELVFAESMPIPSVVFWIIFFLSFAFPQIKDAPRHVGRDSLLLATQ